MSQDLAYAVFRDPDQESHQPKPFGATIFLMSSINITHTSQYKLSYILLDG